MLETTAVKADALPTVNKSLELARPILRKVSNPLKNLLIPRSGDLHGVLQRLAKLGGLETFESEEAQKKYLGEKWPQFEYKYAQTIEVGKKISEYISTILPGKDSRTVRLRQVLLERLLDQQITNPEQYVSHGADHSLEVAGLAGNLYDATPILREQLTKFFGKDAKTILLVTGLLHDAGYPRLSPKENKSLHALKGRELFEEELADKLKNRFGLTEEQIREIAFTIECHPDDGLNSKKPMITASETDHPLLLALRVGDIMDMSGDRLSEIQRNLHFQKIVRRLFIEGQPGGQLNGLSTDEYEKQLTVIRQEELAEVKDDLDPDTFARLDAIVKYVNDVSYPHFVGCMAVKDVGFKQNADGTLTIKVDKKDDIKENLSIGDIPVVDFQVWRAQNALESLRLGGQKLQVAVE